MKFNLLRNEKHPFLKNDSLLSKPAHVRNRRMKLLLLDLRLWTWMTLSLIGPEHSGNCISNHFPKAFACVTGRTRESDKTKCLSFTWSLEISFDVSLIQWHYINLPSSIEKCKVQSFCGKEDWIFTDCKNGACCKSGRLLRWTQPAESKLCFRTRKLT